MGILDSLLRRKAVFFIEWPSEIPTADASLTEPLIFATDVPGLREEDVGPVIERCNPKERPLVFITPGLAASALSLLPASGAFAVRARGLPGQALMELIHDVAVVTGGQGFVRDLGYGLMSEMSVTEESPGGIVLRLVTDDQSGARGLTS